MRTFLLTLFLLASQICQSQSNVLVFLNTRTDKEELPKEELDKLMKSHLDNINRLAAENKLVVAGPFEGGGGIFILNTTSIEEANRWISTDPAIRANRWRVEILAYQPTLGSVCKPIEPYQMVTYGFVRFTPNIHKESVGSYDELLEKHNIHTARIDTKTLVTAGNFGRDEGSILILKEEISQEFINNDPAITGGALQFEIKKLWVAKGSFCEK